ncbi:aminotransferase class III-fold pyridoxal phosphate-dependent enzyme [Catenulispora sp. NL8]|uniref:Aminotransferase class III-fold pyridoxal phosphate-dependent enzyme n=1 Tax=Catenulispora pinistramenti TaxID=2705254 RepID=A0ABS5KNZ9_9ACTN|nr:type I polyketide synthase [Catenulispora pinistramenti]MBS2547774.1 aminotransferase class III-fold pyridoxal phosphate-dependent enzyme [Catenulispora pinistramenti]
MNRAVAIIGTAFRFPGADTAEQFWQTIRDGAVHIRRFTEDDFARAGVPEQDYREPDFVGSSALLDGIAQFDAEYFGISGREAEVTDPQQRLLLECCHHALEDAGYAQPQPGTRVGVYASTGYRLYTMQNYLANNLTVAGWSPDWASGKQVQVGNAPDFAAARVAFRLGLTGPAMSVQTACSSSLVSVHLAARALIAEDADLAVVGSAALHLPQVSGHRHMPGSTISPTGGLRPFDADADGTVGGNGVAAVVLKRLDDALAAGDAIRAVIIGSDVSNDGAGKRGFAAPGVDGQREAAVRALRDAGVPAESIGYLEAHGTGTVKGDPIEYEALSSAYRSSSGATGFCELGTIKGNIGHLDACAGLAALIKAVLVLEHGEIPLLAGHTRINPTIAAADGPFTISPRSRPWPQTGGPRRAAVHSVGMGGTNAHVILQEAPPPAARRADAAPVAVLPLSAHTDGALRDVAEAYRRALTESSTGDQSSADRSRSADVVTTAALGRRHRRHRLVLLGSGSEDFAGAVDDWLEHGATAAHASGSRWLSGSVPEGPADARVTFLFSGQGGPHAGMARELAERFPVFRHALDDCDQAYRAAGGDSLLPDLLGLDKPAARWGTDIAQPAIFAFQTSLVRLWADLGVAPHIVAGHSVGEYAALCAAGALDIADGMRLTAARGRLMAGTTHGRMAAVFADRSLVESLAVVWPGVELAVSNGTAHHVIAGTPEAVAIALRQCDGDGVPWTDLLVDRAFHSSLLDPVLAGFAAVARGAAFGPTTVPFVSGLDGVVRPAGWTPDAEYLVRQARDPVRFDEVLARLGDAGAHGSALLLEIGPDAVLTGLARRALPAGPPAVASQTPKRRLDTFWSALGRLWCDGVEVDWGRLLADCQGRRIPLPTYPFRRTRHWVGPPPPAEFEHRGSTVHRAEDAVLDRLTAIAARHLGCRPAEVGADRPFVGLGADSLQLIGMVKDLEHEFGVRIALRELLEEFGTPALAAELVRSRRSDPDPGGSGTDGGGSGTGVQIRLPAPAPAPEAAGLPVAPGSPASHGPHVVLDADSGMTATAEASQRRHIDELTRRFVGRMPTSKELAQRHRRVLADSRAVVGFRRGSKEMLYPIAAQSAHGSRLVDVDGNSYVDITMGFGALLLGHEPEPVAEAVREHLARGVRLGPRSADTGEVAQLIADLTGHERIAFAASGTEANSAALRLARNATGRDKVVMFSGSYHGHIDSVLGRRVGHGAERGTVPVSPGIPLSAVAELIVLEYGSPESLQAIEALGESVAAVIVEPVQCRNPRLRPIGFVRRLRELTRRLGIALIFDEMLTGFRPHQRGAQDLYGVVPDLSTYGKAVGGGYPIGVIAGSSDVMDGVDGGFWQYGDDSVPPRDTTFFGGTYMQHPVSMAAAKAVLTHLVEEGPALQEGLNARTDRLAGTLNAFFAEHEYPLELDHHGSMFRFRHKADLDLLYHHLVLRGVYVWEWRSFYLSTAHTDDDVDRVVEAVTGSLTELRDAGFFPSSKVHAAPRRAAPAEQLRRAPDFSVYFFGSHRRQDSARDEYALLTETVRFADDHGFHAAWLPERHFHEFGALFPSPSVLASALSQQTSRIRLNAGSVVLPLHDPIRVAEEWSVVDNLSGGRVSIGCASGWHSDDFALYPDRFQGRRELTMEYVGQLRTLWSGGSLTRLTGNGSELEVRLHPRPVQDLPPMFLATGGDRDSFERAARNDLGVVTNLARQSLEELAENIGHYRKIRGEAGLDPEAGRVAVLLHTYLADDHDRARSEAFGPMGEYLRSSLFMRSSAPATGAIDSGSLPDEDLDYLFGEAYARYCDDRALIGSPESCAGMVDKLRAAGVDELAALVDFGMTPERLRSSMALLAELRLRFHPETEPAGPVVPAVEAATQPATAVPVTRTAPATAIQRRLWRACQLTESSAYQEVQAARFDGLLDAAALRTAVRMLITRHDGLRTVFRADNQDGGLQQYIRPDPQVDLRIVDRRGQDPQTAVRDALRELGELPYDPAAGPLFRPVLVRLAATDHVLLFGIHHLITDGHSAEIIAGDLHQCYRAAIEGREPRFDHPAGSAADAALHPAASAEGLEWWRTRLGAVPPVLRLPTDLPRTRTAGAGASQAIELGPERSQRLQSWSAGQGVTLFAALLTAWQVVLRRFSGQDEFLVGSTFGMRAAADRDTVGCFAQVLPLRCSLTGGTVIRAAVRATRDALLDAAEHHDADLEELLASLSPDPAAVRPLITVSADLDSEPLSETGLPGLRARGADAGSDGAPFELGLHALRTAEGLRIRIRYDAGLFAAATVQRFLDHLCLVVDGFVDGVERIGDLPARTEADQALAARLGTGFGLPGVLTDLRSVRPADSDRPAIVDGAVVWSGTELRRAADGVTARLRTLGVGRGDIVAVHLPRGFGYAAAAVGIVAAGAAVLPLDPAQPGPRRAAMIADSQPVAVVRGDGDGAKPTIEACGAGAAVGSAAAVAVGSSSAAVAPDDEFCRLYTSGSTGSPKGIRISHRNMAVVLEGFCAGLGVTGADRIAWYSSVGFDAANIELWPALVAGAELHVVPEEVRLDPRRLIAWYCDEGITRAWLPTAMAEQVIGLEWPAGCRLRSLGTGGEQLNIRPRPGLPFTVLNSYGPTEVAVLCTWGPVDPDGPGKPSLGVPTAGVRLLVGDPDGRELPPGAVGELHVGGDQVALGYHGAEPDADRFRTDRDGRRWYRTGDLVRWGADGNLHFHGRTDGQVKIRGVRVEPGECTPAVAALPGVRAARVIGTVDPKSGHGRLTCFVQPGEPVADEAGQIRAWRRQLRATLPRPMVPDDWQLVSSLPLGVSGKWDPGAMVPADRPAEADAPADAPQTQTDGGSRREAVRELWADVLGVGVSAVGDDADLFDLGGHSITAIKLLSRFRSEFGIDVSVSDFFADPTVAAMADLALDASGTELHGRVRGTV